MSGGLQCGGGASGVVAPGGPGGAFAAQGTLVGKDVNHDGVIEPREMGFIPSGGVVTGGGGMGMACGGGAAGGGAVAYGGAVGGGAYGGAVGGGAGFAHGGGVIAPGGPGGAFAASGTLVGKDANYDGVIEQNEMGFIPNGGGMPAPGPDDCNDCVRTVTTYKTVQVPCTRNRYKVVNYTVPKTVPYTDYQTVTKTRTVTKQMPKTIYVPVKTTVPYQTQVPVTKYKTVNVPKSRTTCEPTTTIVTRRIPVVNVIPNPPPPCPPQPQPCEPCAEPLQPYPDTQPMPLPQPRY